jgi:ionotropic glutamate receptor
MQSILTSALWRQMQNIIWPGGSVNTPRGWVVPKNGRPLDIGVPNKLGYKEFVSMAVDSSNRTTFHGFCIDVFEKALAYLPYSVTFNFHRFGNGSSTPSYDALVAKVVNKVCFHCNIYPWRVMQAGLVIHNGREIGKLFHFQLR